MRAQQLASAGTRPDDAFVAPAPAIPPAAAKEVLARLTRAVQRATIYPERHPATRVATAPLVEAVNAVLRTAPQLVVGVTSGRLFVGAHPEDAEPLDSPWLASRLASLDLAAIRFDAPLAIEHGEALVTWLARASDPGSGVPSDPPTLPGCEINKIDFSAARFREADHTTETTAPDVAAWRAICAALLQDGDDLTEHASDPGDLARRALEGVERYEGAGVGDLAERLSVLGDYLAGVHEDISAAARARLGEFVDALAPDLRRQVLVASPRESPGKLALMEQLLDDMPSPVVLEMVQGLDFVRGSSSHQFLSLVVKLTKLSTADPAIRLAVTQKCEAAGLPPTVAVDSPEAHETLGALLAAGDNDVLDVNPEDYQRRLEQLTASAPIAHQYRIDAQRHVDPRVERDIAASVDHITLLLLRAGSVDPRDLACFDRLRDALPRHLAAGDFGMLADAAVQLVELSTDRAPEVAAGAQRCLRFFVEARTISAVLHAIQHAEDDERPFALTMLARVGEAAFVEALFGALITTSAPHVAKRLADVVPSLDFDVVRTTALSLYRKDPSLAPALLFALRPAIGLPLAADVAYAFLGDRDPAVRIESGRILFGAPLSPGRLDSVVRKALEDDDPKVVDAVLDQLERTNRPTAVPALARFVDQAAPDRFARHQLRAVHLLSGFRTAETVDALVTLLGERNHRLDAPSRRVSCAIVDALQRRDDPRATSAARTWRRSPAGLLSRFMHDGGDA